MQKKIVCPIILIILTSLLTGCISVNQLVREVRVSGDAAEPDETTIIRGLKEALSIGTEKSVQNVSIRDGYFANAAITILLPGDLKEMADRLRKLGFGDQVDEFILTMNRAAEEAAGEALNIFINAVKEITLEDARRILNGTDDAATRYFENKTRKKLYNAFAPAIAGSMEKVGLIRIYNFLLNTYNKIPLIRKVNFNLEDYINNKALDGLFYILAAEEKKIRKDPAARVTELLRQVFGS